MKLFTIGDSISQGFMSGAAARTDLCYSTLLANILEDNNYKYPSWPLGGHPVNIEELFRRLEQKLGSDIAGIFEWSNALFIIQKYLDEIEDYYERGKGSENKVVAKTYYNNVAVRGFDLAYSWMITPDLCRKYISASENKKDNILGMVDQSLLRTALTVLEAGSEKGIKNASQLDWLKYHHQNEGVENLILWLGANNALGTVLSLNIKQTSVDGTAFLKGPDKVSYDDRLKNDWNLWHPGDFKIEYEYMFNKVLNIMEDNPKQIDYKVFIPTIPLVTIAPLIKAAGGLQDREMINVKEWRVNQSSPAPVGINEVPECTPKDYSYGKYYPYFVFAEKFDVKVPHLNLVQAVHIDNTIRQYNKIIIETVAVANQKLNSKKFYLVDISSVLSDMALKRNSFNPPYKYPEFFDFAYPKVDTRYYGTTRQGTIMSGGLFSLDGVHPTAIGQALIAYEFLKVMKIAGIYKDDVEKAIDWKSVFKSDSMFSNPIGLISEVYDNIDLKKWVVKILMKRN
jgi:hypothetical protein